MSSHVAREAPTAETAASWWGEKPGNWWEEPDGSTDRMFKVLLTKFATLIFTSFLPSAQIDIELMQQQKRGSVFSAPWCEPEEWLYVIVKNFHTWGGRRQSDGVSLAVSNATLVSHLIVSLSAVRRSQPAAGPAHVQCVLSRAQNVQCKSALRGPVPCWRRRCRVVSMRRTGWAPPGLDTEPTRTSSAALYPDGGQKKNWTMKLIASHKLYLAWQI